MRRIIVFGCGGAGKSTFSRRLGEQLDLPVVHLDRLYWRPGWVSAPDEEFHAAQREIVAGECWIIDGNYSSSMHIRLARADTAIFLDYPRHLCIRRAALRSVREYGQEKQAPGCPERFDRAFYSFLWHWPKQSRPRVLQRLAEHGGHVRQHVFTRPRDAEDFLRGIG